MLSLRGIKELVTKKIKLAGYTVAVIGVTGFGGTHAYMVYRVDNIGDDYVMVKTQQDEIKKAIHESEIRLLTAIHDKEIACEVLQATVTNGKYTHTYCKE